MSSQSQPEPAGFAPILADFDPLVAEWFTTRFAGPTEPQILGWPEIRAGHDVLISAPTGSGKTLAAFLICLDRLVRPPAPANLPNETEVVYVSPLKALSNDIHKNLEIPLAEISELAARHGIASRSDSHGGPHRRHAGLRAPADGQATRRIFWSPRRNRSTSC